MKVAIVGSRNFRDSVLVARIIRKLVAQHGDNLTIVSGGARGADSIAESQAKIAGVPCQVFPADWERYGKQAGFRRNAEIVGAADMVIALYVDGPLTPGTTHTVTLANNFHKPVHWYHEGRWKTNADLPQ